MPPIDPYSGYPTPNDVATSMVAPRQPAIGRMMSGYTKWQKAYAGGSIVPVLSMGSTTHRAAQTILRGGYAESPNFDILRGFTPTSGSGFKHFMQPKNWGDLAKRETYGARQMVTKFPQSFTRFDSTTIFNTAHEAGTWNPWQLSGVVNPIGKAFPAMQGQDMFTQGTSAMMSASSTMMRMGQSQQLSQQMASNVAATIRQTNPLYAGALETSGYTAQTGAEGAYSLLGANSGMLSSRASGMYAGAKAGFSGGAVPEEILSAARSTSIGGARFAASAERATALAGDISKAGGLLKYAGAARAAGGAGEGVSALMSGGALKGSMLALDAVPGVGEVAMVAQAYMLAKGATHMVKGLVQTGIHTTEDAIKSFKGTIDKPVFGMGFRDTEATLTSRQRGVSAIQNSRLNARSWLGAEAGSMWNHFS